MDRKNVNTRNAYDQWSESYDTDENFTRDLDGTITRITLEELWCNTILEIGCGTGKNTNLLAQIGKRVYAIDFSPGMIFKAVSQIQQGNVQFCIGDITQKWPIEDASIDLVVCSLVLEHIEDLRFIFAETARTLVKNGKFYVSELHPFKQYQGVRANFTRADKRTEIQAFVHHVSDYLETAREVGLMLLALKEWWHENDHNKPPRLVTFMFEKGCP